MKWMCFKIMYKFLYCLLFLAISIDLFLHEHKIAKWRCYKKLYIIIFYSSNFINTLLVLMKQFWLDLVKSSNGFFFYFKFCISLSIWVRVWYRIISVKQTKRIIVSLKKPHSNIKKELVKWPRNPKFTDNSSNPNLKRACKGGNQVHNDGRVKLGTIISRLVAQQLIVMTDALSLVSLLVVSVISSKIFKIF